MQRKHKFCTRWEGEGGDGGGGVGGEAATQPRTRAGGRRGMRRVGLCKRRGMGDTRGWPVARMVLAMARSKARESRVAEPMRV